MPTGVTVVGAGAAGIIAAWRAASLGARVTLLERNDRIGIKILISGGGKCNITQDAPVEELLAAFRPNESRFLRPACYRFGPGDIVEMLSRRGLEVYTRPDGRVFPVDGTAKDVVSILASYLEESGVSVQFRSRVTGIEKDERGVSALTLGTARLESRRVILCTGGCSYPATGATGDGWEWARALGHSTARARAALAPIITDPRPPAPWAGVALRDCVLKGRSGGKEVARRRGDLLFTHRGVSGPAVLAISRIVAERSEFGTISLEVDVLPDTSFEDLTARIRHAIEGTQRRSILSVVEGLVPQRLAPGILAAANIQKETIGARLSRTMRNRLVAVLKGWHLGIASQVPIEKGEVTAGGVQLDEVDPQTMRSRKVDGLYICGEVLDIAGPIGGYNLQAAFATGYLAGETAAKRSEP